MTHDTYTDLAYVIDGILESHEGAERIDPALIASEGLEKLTEAELRHAAGLCLRQLARAACRRRFGREESGGDRDQGDLFPGERSQALQRRYPAARSDGKGPTYILRDSMSADDVAFNVKRLRREGTTKLEHAEALQDWWVVRQARETISPAA